MIRREGYTYNAPYKKKIDNYKGINLVKDLVFKDIEPHILYEWGGEAKEFVLRYYDDNYDGD